MHKGQKITLVPLTPTEIVQADREQAASLNNSKSENQQVANSVFPPKKDKSAPISKRDGIKLKSAVRKIVTWTNYKEAYCVNTTNDVK